MATDGNVVNRLAGRMANPAVLPQSSPPAHPAHKLWLHQTLEEKKRNKDRGGQGLENGRFWCYKLMTNRRPGKSLSLQIVHGATLQTGDTPLVHAARLPNDIESWQLGHVAFFSWIFHPPPLIAFTWIYFTANTAVIQFKWSDDFKSNKINKSWAIFLNVLMSWWPLSWFNKENSCCKEGRNCRWCSLVSALLPLYLLDFTIVIISEWK